MHSVFRTVFTHVFPSRLGSNNSISRCLNVASILSRSNNEGATTDYEGKLEDTVQRLSYLQGLPIVHHPGYVCDLPDAHHFPMKKFGRIYDILVQDGVIQKEKQIILPPKISYEVACTAHDAAYVDKVFNGKTTEEEQRITGFQWTPELASRVRYEVGGTVLGAMLALEKGMACSTAGGSHHAFPDHGSGYCLLNDLAIASSVLVEGGMVENILIVDLDAHQGDGTAFIFKSTPNVFTFSMHCGKIFPSTKQQSDVDVELEDGVDDEVYLNALMDCLPMLLENCKPDLVLYDAGVDPHEDDELGLLNLTDEGLYERDSYVLETLAKHGVPCMTVVGGGYSRNVDVLARRHTIVHRVASKVWEEFNL